MKDLGKTIRSIFGTLVLAALAGCVVLALGGDTTGSLFYLDAALLFLAICILVPILLPRIYDPSRANKIFTLVATIVFTATILLPFVLITMKQGRLALFGIIVGMIIYIVILSRTIGGKEKTGSIEKWFYALIAFFPFVYALILWSDLQVVASFLVLAAVNSLLYLDMLLKSNIGYYTTREDWKPLSIELPDLEPIVLSDDIISIEHFNHMELGMLETRRYQLQFPVTYEVNGLYYKKEAFMYNWFAPFEDRLRAFNLDTDFKGKYLNFIYDPEDPSNLSLALGRKEDIEQLIFNYKKRQKRYQIYALGIAVLGILLFFF